MVNDIVEDGLFLTTTPGLGGRLKESDADFVVREISPTGEVADLTPGMISDSGATRPPTSRRRRQRMARREDDALAADDAAPDDGDDDEDDLDEAAARARSPRWACKPSRSHSLDALDRAAAAADRRGCSRCVAVGRRAQAAVPRGARAVPVRRDAREAARRDGGDRRRRRRQRALLDQEPRSEVVCTRLDPFAALRGAPLAAAAVARLQRFANRGRARRRCIRRTPPRTSPRAREFGTRPARRARSARAPSAATSERGRRAIGRGRGGGRRRRGRRLLLARVARRGPGAAAAVRGGRGARRPRARRAPRRTGPVPPAKASFVRFVLRKDGVESLGALHARRRRALTRAAVRARDRWHQGLRARHIPGAREARLENLSPCYSLSLFSESPSRSLTRRAARRSIPPLLSVCDAAGAEAVGARRAPRARGARAFGGERRRRRQRGGVRSARPAAARARGRRRRRRARAHASRSGHSPARARRARAANPLRTTAASPSSPCGCRRAGGGRRQLAGDASAARARKRDGGRGRWRSARSRRTASRICSARSASARRRRHASTPAAVGAMLLRGDARGAMDRGAARQIPRFRGFDSERDARARRYSPSAATAARPRRRRSSTARRATPARPRCARPRKR